MILNKSPLSEIIRRRTARRQKLVNMLINRKADRLANAPKPESIILEQQSSPSVLNTPTNITHPEPCPTPRKRNKKLGNENQPIPLERLRWLTIAQTALRFPAFSEKALRHLVAAAEAHLRYPQAGRKSNGFIACVIRPAGQRKILIDAEQFEAWLKSFSLVSQQ